MKTVVICAKDDGTVMVGELPDGETYSAADDGGAPGTDANGGGDQGGGAEGGGDQAGSQSYMQPAKSVDDALSMARDMLSQNPQQDAQADKDMQQGYNEVRGPEAANPFA